MRPSQQDKNIKLEDPDYNEDNNVGEEMEEEGEDEIDENIEQPNKIKQHNRN